VGRDGGSVGPRVALVTGAARGIGAAVAERLRSDGVYVHGVDLEDGYDLTTREANRRAVDDALAQYGRLDTVVANAGFQHVAPVAEFDEDRWDALLALLLTSPFLLAKYAWDALCTSGDGRFVVIASVHGLVASPYKAGYVSAASSNTRSPSRNSPPRHARSSPSSESTPLM
jgi:3-hydroxybutyrate dehydrogenase